MENLVFLIPNPLPEPSNVLPRAWDNSELKSCNNSILSAPVSFWNAFWTNTLSLLNPYIASTPFPLNASTLALYPGNWLAHVPVNAAGNANKTTFLFLNKSSVDTFSGPSSPNLNNYILSILLSCYAWDMR